LNNKLRATRKYLDGSVKHTAGQLKIEKLSLSYLIDEVDARAEVRPLSEEENEPKSQSNAQIASFVGSRGDRMEPTAQNPISSWKETRI
jgi:hypothetical protein